MKKIIEAVIRDMPKEIKGYHLLKRQSIYVPHREIGVVCLTKEISEINLFYETILKLIDIGVCDIKEISDILGVEFKLLKEVIVDMIQNQYIYTTQNHLTMTLKGRNALNTRKHITIQKRNINQIVVDMITGSFLESDSVTSTQVRKFDICLNEKLNITKDFLDAHYAMINDIYQKNQIENSIFHLNNVSQELYEILDIAYDNLFFVRKELLIYQSNDSDDLQFIISKDFEEKYLTVFYEQIKGIIFPGLENLFEKDWDFASQCKIVDRTKNAEREQTDKLISLLHNCEEITENVEHEFISNRNLIDNKEIEKYFMYPKEINYEGIIIAGSRLRKTLSDNLIDMINGCSKQIVIFYERKEYDIENYLNRRFAQLVKKKKIKFVGKENLHENYICLYPNVYITLCESVIKVFERYITILDGKIDFNSKQIRSKLENYIEENNINFNRSEKKSDTIGKQANKKKYKKNISKRAFEIFPVN